MIIMEATVELWFWRPVGDPWGTDKAVGPFHSKYRAKQAADFWKRAGDGRQYLLTMMASNPEEE